MSKAPSEAPEWRITAFRYLGVSYRGKYVKPLRSDSEGSQSILGGFTSFNTINYRNNSRRNF
jgi:hypothetical protein